MSVAVYVLHGAPFRGDFQDSINLAESLAASSGQAIPVLDSLQEPIFFDDLILAVEPSFDFFPELRTDLITMRNNQVHLVGVVLFVGGVDENDVINPIEKEIRDLLFWGAFDPETPFYTVDPDQMRREAKRREAKARFAGRLPAELVNDVKGRVVEDRDLSGEGTSLLVEAAGGPEGFGRLVTSAMKNRFNEKSGSLPRFTRDIRVVTQALRRVWSREAAIAWLRSPNTYLEGARPMDVLSLQGPNQVVDALKEASAGRYA